MHSCLSRAGLGEMFKSDVKFVEASSLGLATLASPAVYGASILDGVTGMIVPDIEGWAGALESLVSDQARTPPQVATAAYVIGRASSANFRRRSSTGWPGIAISGTSGLPSRERCRLAFRRSSQCNAEANRSRRAH